MSVLMQQPLELLLLVNEFFLNVCTTICSEVKLPLVSAGYMALEIVDGVGFGIG